MSVFDVFTGSMPPVYFHHELLRKCEESSFIFQWQKASSPRVRLKMEIGWCMTTGLAGASVGTKGRASELLQWALITPLGERCYHDGQQYINHNLRCDGWSRVPVDMTTDCVVLYNFPQAQSRYLFMWCLSVSSFNGSTISITYRLLRININT